MADLPALMAKSLVEASSPALVPLASARLKQQLSSMEKVETTLDIEQMAELKSLVTVPLDFSCTRPACGHAVLSACRELARNKHDALAKTVTTSSNVLVVGASMSDVRRTGANPHISYYFRLTESKDMTRTTSELTSQLRRCGYVSTHPGGSVTPSPYLEQLLVAEFEACTLGELFCPGTLSFKDSYKFRRAVERLFDLAIASLGERAIEKGRAPKPGADYDTFRLIRRAYIYDELPRVDELQFPDSIYNISGDELCQYFSATGALVGSGYAALPPELLFVNRPGPEGPGTVRLADHGVYCYRQIRSGGKEYAVMSHPTDPANGYVHELRTWSTLMRSPYVGPIPRTGDRKPLHLYSEFVANYGPMRVFRFYVSGSTESFARTIACPDWAASAMVLDVRSLFDPSSGAYDPRRVRRYVPVLLSEWYYVYYAALRLNVNQRTVQNVLNMLHKRKGGVALVSRTLAKPFKLADELLLPISAAATILASAHGERADLCADRIKESTSNYIGDIIAAIYHGGLDALSPLLNLFRKHGLVEKLVFFPHGVEHQVGGLDVRKESARLVDEHLAALVQAIETDAPGGRNCYLDPELPPGGQHHDPPVVQESAQGVSCAACTGVRYVDADKGLKRPAGWEQGAICESCDFCHMLMGIKLHEDGGRGRQEWLCSGGPAYYHEVDLGPDDILNFLNEMRDDRDKQSEGNALHKAIDGAVERIKQFAGGVKGGFEVEFINAGPGTGKSHVISQLVKQGHVIVVPFGELRNEMADKCKALGKYDIPIYTQHHAMAKTLAAEAIWVDECFCMDRRPIEIMGVVLGVRKIYIFGDPSQTKMRTGIEGEGLGDLWPLERMRSHELVYNFRNPPGLLGSTLLRSLGYRLRTHRSDNVPVRIVPYDAIYDVDAWKDHKILFFTHDEVTSYANRMALQEGARDKLTVRANQGKTFRNVLLVVGSDRGTCHTASVHGMLAVALTRHTHELVVAMDHDCPLRGDFLKLEEESKLELVERFVGPVPSTVYRPAEVVEPELPIVPVVRPENDGYLGVEQLAPPHALGSDIDSANEPAQAVGHEEAVNGVVDPEALLNPMTNRGNPQASASKSYAIGPGSGLHFADTTVQALKTAVARYCNKRPNYPRTATGEALARQMVRDVVKHYTPGLEVPGGLAKYLPDDAELAAIVERWLGDADRRNYFARVERPTEENIKTVVFAIKRIFKVITTSAAENITYEKLIKPGQGIASYPTLTFVVFGAAFRVIAEAWRRFCASTLEGEQVLVCDSGLTEEEFFERVSLGAAIIAPEAKWVITDGTMFDSMQTWFTHEIEKEWLRMFGADEAFIESAFLTRTQWGLNGSCFWLRADTQNASGHAWTLLGNTWVSVTASHHVLSHVGPSVTVAKGDDFARRALKPEYHEKRAIELGRHMALKLKIDIGDGAEFCGLAATGSCVYPSIVRRVQKVIGTRFRDYEHFCEYKPSLTTFVQQFDRLDEYGLGEQFDYASNLATAGNMSLYGISYDDVAKCRSFLLSLTHLDERQFHETFRVVVDGTCVERPAAKGAGPSVECISTLMDAKWSGDDTRR